jgi:heat shock protein HslJ
MHVGAPEPIAGGRRYAGRADGRVLVVTLRDRVCTDAATGLPHPLTVDVTLDEQRLRGCGGDPASLLRGEWRVEELGGIAVTAAPRITLVFGAQGRVSGEASCNRYTGTIEVTGEGIVFGQLVATRRACAAAAMDQERSFLEVLGRVRMFELPGDGTLVLHAMDGRTVRARR